MSGESYYENPVYGEENKYKKYIPWVLFALLFVVVLYNLVIALVWGIIDMRVPHFILLLIVLLTYVAMIVQYLLFRRAEEFDWRAIVQISLIFFILVLEMAAVNAYVWPAFQPHCPSCDPPSCPLTGIYFTDTHLCATGTPYSDCMNAGDCITFSAGTGACAGIDPNATVPTLGRGWN